MQKPLHLDSQLLRALCPLIHSRSEMALKAYEREYPQTDIVLLEPDHRDPEMYLANTFS